MTTVVAHLGQRRMIADTRASSDGEPAMPVQKLYRLEDGRILGYSGTINNVPRLIHAFKKGKQLRRSTDCELLVLSEDGILHVDSLGGVVPCAGPYYAIGSGAHAALGALDAGASLRRAMKIAADRDPFTGANTTEIRL